MMTVIVKAGTGHVAGDTRDRMVQATIELLQQRGYAGTSFGDVTAASGAPRGSIYHHFPGGKQQLVAEAVTRYAEGIARRLRTDVQSGHSRDVVGTFVDVVRTGLRASDFSRGCAIAAVVLDVTPSESVLLDLGSQALGAWRRVLQTAFQRDGAEDARARRLATFVVAAVEGALILARADRDLTPVNEVAAELDRHLASGVG
jgi:AcrR family transcriptional regulator